MMIPLKAKLAIALALLLALLSAPKADAQANAANYLFSTTTTGSLTDMSSGTTTLVAADQDDTASPVTLLGFDFYFMGVRQDRFSVNSNGTLRFGATVISNTAYNPLAQAGQALITGYGADQRTHVSGRVHFKVTGSAPNRVLIVEWLNMQSDFNPGGTADLTYQVRLFETTGAIEFVYASMSMSAAGALDANSNSPQYGFSSNSAVGTVGSITAAQSGTPAPTFNGASAVPVNNLYAAGSIPVLTSVADGSRRTFLLAPPAVNPPGAPLTFTGVTTTAMTLNWTDSSNEAGYLIHISTDGTNFSLFNTAPQNATSFPATGLVGSTTYFWRVYAFNEGTTAFIAGSQATAAPTPNTTVATGLWSNPATWSTGVPTAGDAVTIAGGTSVTIDIAAVAYSVSVAGMLQFEQTTARTLTVGTDATVQGGGTFQSNPAGTQAGHNLSIGGSLTNDGTLDFSTNANTAGAIITFTGAANTSFSGTGATTDIRQITVSKGTTPAAIVEVMPTNFTVRGVTTDVAAWLVMANGTIKVSGTFTGTNRVFAAAAYIIPASFGFWLNNPNYTVAAQAGNAVNNGVWRVSQGTFNQGTLVTHSFRSGAGAVFTIEGGTVNCAGQFSPQNAVTYNQSGGTLNVGTVGNSQSNFGTFELFSAAAVFNMTGGTINIVQASTGATQVDYQNLATVAAATGTVQVGTGATVTKFTFNIRGSLPNLVIDNTTNNKSATVTLANSIILGNTTVNSGTTLGLGGVLVAFGGPTLTNNGTINGTAAGSRMYFFETAGVPQTYTGTGVVTAPLASIDFDSVGGVTLDPAVSSIVTSRAILFTGNVTNSNKLTLGNGGATTGIVQIGNTTVPTAAGTFDLPFTFNLGTGGQILSYLRTAASRTTGPEVNPARSLTTFTYDDNDPTHTLTIGGGDLTVTGNTAGSLALTNGRVITNANTLHFNPSGAVGTVTRTTGYVDGNFRKTVTAAGSRTFEVGTANGYTPVVFNVTAGTFPADVTVAAVQATQPNLPPGTDAITRYWRLTAAGITADLTFNYLDPADIPGGVTEANLRAFRYDPPAFTDMGGTVNTAANNLTVTGVSTFSDWTLGEPGADLSITKTDGVTTATAGGSTTYTITASNAGPSDNPAATVADTFPAALTCNWTCAGAGGGTCTAAGAGNINDAVNLPSGGSVTYTASCTISPSATGSLSNTATVSGGAVPDGNAANDSATDVDTLGASADLAITKTDGVAAATPGGSVTYTITASNAGPSAATGATVADTFPASLTCTWTCAGAGGGTCTAAGSGNINDTVNLPAGGSVTYTASCSISAAATGTLTNTATVAAPAGVTDPNAANDSATDNDTLGASADLAITKTDGVATATPGGSVTYTINASNAGPSNATGATVADTFPASLTCTWTCVGAGGGTCTAAGSGNINDTVNLPAGGSVTYTASCTISGAATGTLSNTATVAAPAGVTDPNAANDSATDNDTLGASADLAITKTDGVATATPGGSVTYTINASNAGPSNATGATVADTFPASLTCNWTCAGAGGGTCTAAGSGNINDTVNLPAGGSVTYTASCTISAAASGTLSNTATVAAPAGVTDPNATNDSATDSDTLGASADLAITKTDGVTSVTAGGSVTYIIAASNAGPSSATGATVADTFPASLTCTWTCVGAGGGTCTAAGSGNINDTVNLPVGGSVTYTASCTISAAATGTLSNTATVAAPAGVTDPTPVNNSATDSDTIDAAPAGADVTGTKTAAGTFVPGGNVTYTIVLTNNGAGAQGDNTGNEFSDVLPAQLALTSATATNGTAATAGNTVTWNGSIPAGGSVTITINASILPSATGTISNQGTIFYDPEGDGTNTSSRQTDDPAAGGASNPTIFALAVAIEVPTLSEYALLALMLAMAFAAFAMLRRQSASL